MLIRLWWAHVTVDPEAKRTAVFNRGIEKGFNGQTPEGGHVHPMSGVGERLLWKKVQKNAEKNMISDTINKIIPHSSPCCTFIV